MYIWDARPAEKDAVVIPRDRSESAGRWAGGAGRRMGKQGKKLKSKKGAGLAWYFTGGVGGEGFILLIVCAFGPTGTIHSLRLNPISAESKLGCRLGCPIDVYERDRVSELGQLKFFRVKNPRSAEPFDSDI